MAVKAAITTFGMTSDISMVAIPPNGPPVVIIPLPFFNVSSRQMKSQQELPTRKDLQSFKY